MRGPDDRGATAVVVGIMLLLLVGMAAIALDLAAGWNERRQDQTSSDLAAVAGALSFGDNDAVADEAMLAARLNLDAQYTNGAWIALWTGCTDPDRPAGFQPINHSSHGVLDCISVNPSFVRLRLPDQLLDTTFGKVLGVDSLTTHADTIVTLLGEGASGSLPFAVRGDTTSGEICLDTSTGGKIVPPCDGNESGSFGNIAPPLFGNAELGTSPSCGHQTSANNYVPQSIAMGIDHTLWKFTVDQWKATTWDPDDNTSKNNVDAVANMDECTDTGGDVASAADGVPINGVYVDTGNSTKTDITEGLMTGTGFADHRDARLTRTGPKRHVNGYDLDNVPLWDHLGSSTLSACDVSSYTGLSIDDKNLLIRTCLETWTGAVGQIFDDLILTSARLGTVPRLWHNNLGSGLSFRPIQSFDIVYIHGLWFDDKDETVFYPGEDTLDMNLNKMKEIEQVTAFLLHDDMVSLKVHTELGGLTNDTFQPTIYE